MRLSLPRWMLRSLALSLVLLIGLAAGAAAFAVRDALAASHEIESAQQDLRGALNGGDLLHVTPAQVGSAERKLDHAAVRLRRDRRLLTPVLPLMPLAGWLPLAGRPLSEAPSLLALAQEVAEGGAGLARGVGPLLAETEASDGGQPLPAQPLPTPAAGGESRGDRDAGEAAAARLMRALDAGSADLLDGDRLLHRAEQRRVRLHPASYRGPLHPVRRRIELLDSQLSTALQQADALALLPGAARTLLGFAGPRTYAVLGQDSAELRATGGFIGSAGLVTLEQGRLTFQEYRSSYDFDGLNVPPLVPPSPLRQYLGTAAWYLRDANWSPDFPTAAAQVLDFVARDTGIQPDGVIGFDTYAVTDLLRAIGPLQVAGFPEPVTAENWFDLTTRAIFTGPDSLASSLQNYNQAKGLGLGAVLRAALAKAQAVHGRDLLGVVDELRQAVLGSHLLLALNDQKPATWARLVDADGAWYPPRDGDLVGPVETNVSYSKVGPYVERRLLYDVWLDVNARPLRSRLELTYRNGVTEALVSDPAKRIEGTRWLPDRGHFVPAPGLYGDYLRIYLPGGTTLESETGLDGPLDLYAESGYTVFAGLLALDPLDERSVIYVYRPAFVPLPAAEYRLSLLKQAGVEQWQARVNIHLASGTKPASLPLGSRQEGDTIVLELNLAATRDVDVHVVNRDSR